MTETTTDLALRYGNNLDTSIVVLASEIRGLNTSSKSMQVEMGHKLIALRELLREKYGANTRSKPDPTGNYPPNGWNRWVAQNLPITCGAARVCIQFAVDPDRQIRMQRTASRKHDLFSYKKALATARRCWPNLSRPERDLLVQGILTLWKESEQCTQ